MRFARLGLALLLIASVDTRADNDSHFAAGVDFSPAELFTLDSARRISEGPGKYNLLDANLEVRKSLDGIRAESRDPIADLFKYIRRDDQFYRPQKELLKKLGELSSLSGRAIYYPFGGMDTHTPFLLDPRAQDAFLQTADPFGTAGDLVKLATLDQYAKVGGFWGPFDSFRDLAMMESEYKMEGSGAFATARIQRHVRGEIVGIYPLSIEENGRIALREPKAGEVISNALVVFRDPESGQLKRFWHFQYRLGAEDPRFERLANRLKFGTMLIKGLPSMAFEGELRENTLRITTEQAIRNQATVISEVRLVGSNNDVGASTPQPIFKRGAAVQTITFPGDVDKHFGYSYSAHPVVFVGDKDSLIDSSTPVTEVEQRSVCEAKYATFAGKGI